MTNLNQNGRSMIEMLGVLAIIGVLSVGGIAGYSKAMLKFKTNKTIDQIAMTVTNIRTLYAQQPAYDITTADAYDMGVIDDAMYVTKKEGDKQVFDKLTNAFNGTVYVEPAQNGAIDEKTSNHAFVLTFSGLPSEACMAIATNDWGSNYSSGMLGITVGAGTVKAVDNDCHLASGVAVTAKTTGDNYTAAPQGSVKACASDKAIPLNVAQAASGCVCPNNNCFVSFKYY